MPKTAMPKTIVVRAVSLARPCCHVENSTPNAPMLMTANPMRWVMLSLNQDDSTAAIDNAKITATEAMYSSFIQLPLGGLRNSQSQASDAMRFASNATIISQILLRIAI